MKVYIVIWESMYVDESDEIIKVFLSEQKADYYARGLNIMAKHRDNNHDYYEYNVEQ